MKFSVKILFNIGTVFFIVPASCNKTCECECGNDKFVCDILSSFAKKLSLVEEKIKEWVRQEEEIKGLHEDVSLCKIKVKNLENEMDTMNNRPYVENLVYNESLIRKPKDIDTNSLKSFSIPPEELTKNMSTLLSKMEEMESITKEFQEELKTERRVRRHLEEELDFTKHGVQELGHLLENVTKPVDQRVDLVEEVVFSKLDDLNKTILEDYLKKIEYKVNGVVYQNETTELVQRLNQIESQVMEGENSSAILTKLSEEMENILNMMDNLNSSIDEKISSGNLIHITRLEEGLSDLLNNTEVFKKEITLLRKDMQEIQINTNFGGEILENLVTQTVQAIDEQSLLLANLTEHVDNLTSDIIQVKSEIETTQTEMIMLKADIAVTETKLSNLLDLSEENSMKTTLENLQGKVYELSKYQLESLSKLETKLEELKYKIPESHNGKITNNPKTDELSDVPVTISSNTNQSSNRTNSDFATRNFEEYIPCTLPQVDDPHLLVQIEYQIDGKQKLIFGCQPISEYVLSEMLVPFICIQGIWIGNFPTCLRLLDKEEISVLEMKEKGIDLSLCRSEMKVADPTDCTQYYECWDGQNILLKCPSYLYFNKLTKLCDKPNEIICLEKKNIEPSKELIETIPRIIIEPNKVDKPYGLMATGPKGELVVYPGITFSLICEYPEGPWGKASWNVPSGSNKKILIYSSEIQDTGYYYTCTSPFGKKNTIFIEVKAIVCPPIEEINGLKVHYRPLPDQSLKRIMSTQVYLECKDELNGYSAMCLVNGSWSSEPPICKTPDKPQIKCKAIDTSHRIGLMPIEETPAGETVTFKCTNGETVRGLLITRCLDNGSWSYDELPSCIDEDYYDY